MCLIPQNSTAPQCSCELHCSGNESLNSGRGPAPQPSSPGPEHSRSTCQERPRLLLLVVEDNRVNQVVALGILENLGYTADVAVDGKDALCALARKPYDLVLMDCQMPGMDGYEATRMIRQRDSAVRNHDIPIVAVTANAVAGDRELCMAAGMNDYISKPFRADLLEQTIEKWTARSTAENLPARLPLEDLARPPADTSAKIFDPEDLIDRLMGNQKLAQRTVRGFLEDVPRQLARLAQAVSEGDAGQVRLLAHSIKGASSGVCGLEMQKAAWILEQMGRAGDLTGATAGLSELSASFARVRPVMEHFSRPDLPATSGGQVFESLRMRHSGDCKRCLRPKTRDRVRWRWWPGTESNRRRRPFQGCALPAELPGRVNP